jgi:hypothetical protein
LPATARRCGSRLPHTGLPRHSIRMVGLAPV